MQCKTIFFSVVFSLCLSAPGSQAQNAPHRHPQLDPSEVIVIDGEQHPELIPDSTAYRMFLLTASTAPNPTDEDRARQYSYLAMIHLEEKDREQAIAILGNFGSQYNSLVKRFNESATALLAQNVQPDLKTFLQQRDDLVQSTRDALKRSLSNDGMARFDAYVQGEKKRMKIHTSKEGQ